MTAFKTAESPFKSDNTASNQCGFTLMNNQVGAVVAKVLGRLDNVTVRHLPSMIRIDGIGKFERRRVWSRSSGVVDLDESARDFGDRDVGLLRQLPEPVERAVRVDSVALHEHALGLADDVTGGQGAAELHVAAHRTPGQRGVGGPDESEVF